MFLILALSLCSWGGVDWHQGLERQSAARKDYFASLSRFKQANDWEKPAHVVTLSKPFYMGKCEVTQEQYEQVMGSNPSQFKGLSNPVNKVSWDDVKAFFKKVGEGLRLPSEAEWEYACRAGAETTYSSGDREADLSRVGWYQKNSGGMPHPVGTKESNAFGLYDMHGNVWEWCEDDGHDSYDGAPRDGSVWVDSPQANSRVWRGGGWMNFPVSCRCTFRIWGTPVHRGYALGFRLSLDF